MADWSAIDQLTPVESPMQLCPTYIGDAQKSYKSRTTGLAEKYTEASDLSYFAEEFWRHMVTTGMDTVAYLEDVETHEMMSVVINHSRFTLANATPTAHTQAQSYDALD